MFRDSLSLELSLEVQNRATTTETISLVFNQILLNKSSCSTKKMEMLVSLFLITFNTVKKDQRSCIKMYFDEFY